MLLRIDMIYVKRGSEYLYLHDPTVFTAVSGALADHSAGGTIHHTAVGQEAPVLRLEHRNKLQPLHVDFIFGTLVG
jgi:hypothetical protein